MQYSLPQFVDVEDKIIEFPPLTLRQFLTFVAVGVLSLLYWYIFGIGVIFAILALPTFLAGAVLGFLKFNGRPIMANAPGLIHYYTAPKYRIFMRLDDSTAVVKKQAPVSVAETGVPTPPVTSRLKKLAYLLDEKSAEEQRLLRTGQNQI